jgi:hypothetical protein
MASTSILFRCLSGTEKLQVAVRAIQNRGKSMQTTAETYNRLVDDLYTIRRPTWFPQNDIPQKLDKKSFSTTSGMLDISPDAQLWEDIGMASVWFALWGTDYSNAPAYVRSSEVRCGIATLLKLDRIQEEEQRLKLEEANLIEEFNSEFIAACEMYKHLKGWFFPFPLVKCSRGLRRGC